MMVSNSKVVKFDFNKTVYIEPTYDDLLMNEDEILACYYTWEEFQSFRDEIQIVVLNATVAMDKKLRLRKKGQQRRQQTPPLVDDSNDEDSSSEEEFCLRGLESRIQRQRQRSGSKSRRFGTMKIRSKQAVLEEQERQRKNNDNEDNDDFDDGFGSDSEMIAQIYKGFCLTSVSQAIRIAQYDAVFARKYLQPENTLFVDNLPLSTSTTSCTTTYSSCCGGVDDNEDNSSISTATTISSTGSSLYY